MAAAKSTDAAGNSDAGAGPSATVSVNNSTPVVNISTPADLDANLSQSTSFTVTYVNRATSPDLQNSDITYNYTGGVTCDAPVITNGNTDTATVDVSNCTGDGTVSFTIGAGEIQNESSANSAASTSAIINVDNTKPTISIGAPSASVVNSSGSVSYTLSYEIAPSPALVTGDITVNGANTGCVAGVANGSTINPVVTVSSCSGNGNITISVASGQSTDAAGNSDDGSGPSGATTIDNTAPTVSIGAPSLSDTKAADTVDFTLTYEIAPTALVTGDISFGGTDSTGCSVSGIASAATVNPVVSVTGCSGNGTVSITVAAGESTDTAGNTDAGATSTTFNVDNTAPTVSIGSPSLSDAKAADTVDFTLTYEIAPTALVTGDISFGGTDTTGCSVSGIASAATVNPVVSVTGCSGNGTVSITVAAGESTDTAGNADAGATSTTFNVDNTAPTVSIGSPSLSDAKAADTVDFTLTYEIAPTALVTGDISFGGTDTTGCSVSGIASAATVNPVVSVTGCSGNGTVSITVAAGESTDTAGNADAGATSTTFNIDNVAPTVSIGLPSSASTDVSNPVTFTLTYEIAPSALVAGDITISGNNTGCSAAIADAATTTPDVTISGCSNNGGGDITISVAAGESSDAAGNTDAGAGPSNTVVVDGSVPSVNISTPGDLDANAAQTTSFTITYTNRATAPDLLPGDISYNYTGGVTCDTPVVTNGNTDTATVDVSNCSGDGTVSFTIAAGEIQSASAQDSPAATSATINVDNTAPTVSIGIPSNASFSSSGSVSYTLTYEEIPSPDLAAGDITVNGTNTDCTVGVTNGNTVNPVVTVSNCSGNGSITISVAPAQSADTTGNTDAGAGPSAATTVDNTAPTVSIGSPSLSDANSSDTVTFTLTYEIAPTALVAGDISFGGTDSTGCSVSGIASAATVNPVVSVTGCSGNGTVSITVAAGESTDTAGNADAGATSTTFNVDNTAPTVSIGSPSLSDAKAADTVDFTLTYEIAPTALVTGDISFGGTDTTGCSVSGIASAATVNPVVSVTGCSGNGTVSITVAAGESTDTAGNADAGATSTTFNVDNTAPTVSIGSPSLSDAKAADTVDFTLTYEIAPTALVTGDISFGGTDTTGCSVSGIASAATVNPVVSVTGCSGNGTVSITVAAGESTDTAGNTDAGATSTTFNVDNVDPSVSVGDPSPTLANASTTVAFTLTYDFAPSPDLTSTDITFGGTDSTDCSVGSITNPGSTSPIVNVTGCSGNGTVSINVAAAQSSDAAGNTDPGVSSGTFTVDNVAPTVSIGAPSAGITDSVTPVFFTLTYELPPSALVAGDITINGNNAGCSAAIADAATTTPDVTISGCTNTGGGSITISVAAGETTDAAGNSDAGAGPSSPVSVESSVTDSDGDGVNSNLDYDDTKPNIGIVVPMVTVWSMGAGQTLNLPLVSGYDYNFTVSWGDGDPDDLVTAFGDPDASHTYTNAGTYTVTITGLIEAWNLASHSNATNLVQVTELGAVGWLNLSNAFNGASAMTTFAGGDTQFVTDMSYMFATSSGVGIAADFSSFNTSSVTTFASMFENNAQINPKVGDFDFSAAVGTNTLLNTFNNNTGLSQGCYNVAIKRIGTTGQYNAAGMVAQTMGNLNATTYQVCKKPNASKAITERNNLVGGGWTIPGNNTTANNSGINCTDADNDGWPVDCDADDGNAAVH